MSLSEEQKDNKTQGSSEAPKEAAAPAPEAEKSAEAATAPVSKAFTPKSTAGVNPTQCAGCAKNLKKKLWYYRNNNYFCNNQCYVKKVAEDAKKAAVAAEKAKAEAEKANQA